MTTRKFWLGFSGNSKPVLYLGKLSSYQPKYTSLQGDTRNQTNLVKGLWA